MPDKEPQHRNDEGFAPAEAVRDLVTEMAECESTLYPGASRNDQTDQKDTAGKEI